MRPCAKRGQVQQKFGGSKTTQIELKGNLIYLNPNLFACYTIEYFINYLIEYLINVAFESFGIDEIAPLKKTDMKIEIQMDFSNQ